MSILTKGKILEVPCSRVGHTFRRHYEYRNEPEIDFVAHNFKRIAEVKNRDKLFIACLNNCSRFSGLARRVQGIFVSN
jgi:hypothetical protein